MKTVYLDFETYYAPANGYSLSKLTYQQYLHDPRFEVIGVSIAIDDGEAAWFAGAKAKTTLAAIDWANARLVAQNAMFDASILHWKFGHLPAAIACTMSMARASGVHLLAKGASLSALALFARSVGVAMPLKGMEVLSAAGKRLADFTPIELATYGEYCRDDTRIARGLYKMMRPLLTNLELLWHDSVIRAYIEPTLMLDSALLNDELARVAARRAELFARVNAQHGADIRSNPKLAKILESWGVLPPTKTSKKTGKEALAFAKTDEGFTALLEHENEQVRVLVEVRLGVKSSIEQTRAQTFLELAGYGPMPMGYNVSGAHTGRLSGTQKNNVQNLPAGRNGQSNALRRAIVAPPGHNVVVVDSSNIEPRVLALMAGAAQKLQNFKEGKDPYLAAASLMWGDDLAELTTRYAAKEPLALQRRQIAKSAELGLGYNAGPNGYMVYCRTMAKTIVSLEEATQTVALWRAANAAVVTLWKTAGAILADMVKGGKGAFGGLDGKLFTYDGQRTLFGKLLPGIKLPDGYWLNYMNLRVERDEVGRPQLIYDQFKGKNSVPTKIYGGCLVENLAQATAGAVIKHQAALVRARYKMVMQTHDELVVIAPETDAGCEAFLAGAFAVTPPWLAGVTLKGEVGTAKRYGDT